MNPAFVALYERRFKRRGQGPRFSDGASFTNGWFFLNSQYCASELDGNVMLCWPNFGGGSFGKLSLTLANPMSVVGLTRGR